MGPRMGRTDCSRCTCAIGEVVLTETADDDTPLDTVGCVRFGRASVPLHDATRNARRPEARGDVACVPPVHAKETNVLLRPF